jgi:hypothetical protein
MRYFLTVYINETTDLTDVEVGRCVDYLTRACNSRYTYYWTLYVFIFSTWKFRNEVRSDVLRQLLLRGIMSSVMGHCYSLKGIYRHFEGTPCLRPQSRRLPKTLMMDNIHFSETPDYMVLPSRIYCYSKNDVDRSWRSHEILRLCHEREAQKGLKKIVPESWTLITRRNNKELFRMQFDISSPCYNLTVSGADIMSPLGRWCCDRFEIECSWTGWHSGNVLNSYWRGGLFESWPGHQLSWLIFFVLFLRPSRQIPGVVPRLHLNHFHQVSSSSSVTPPFSAV